MVTQRRGGDVLSTNPATILTSEQEQRIVACREKWRAIAHSTTPIDRQQATDAIHTLYRLRPELGQPDILFFQSPQGVSDYMASMDEGTLQSTLGLAVWFHLRDQLEASFQPGELHPDGPLPDVEHFMQYRNERDVWKQPIFWHHLATHFDIASWSHWFRALETPLGQDRRGQVIKPEIWASFASFIDFCLSEWAIHYDAETWSLFQQLIQHCSWIFPFEKAVLVCDRPCQIKFDAQHRLHAEGEPAVEFADGLKVYAHHGLRLPEYCGVVPPSAWKIEWIAQEDRADIRHLLIQTVDYEPSELRAEWILQENNAEIRHLLIENIGYDRICQELDAVVLDSWREYTLLRIQADVDGSGWRPDVDYVEEERKLLEEFPLDLRAESLDPDQRYQPLPESPQSLYIRQMRALKRHRMDFHDEEFPLDLLPENLDSDEQYQPIPDEPLARIRQRRRERKMSQLAVFIRRSPPQPAHLLKMTCPSTGHVHALRVPPHIRSAHEAACWINHGIDPTTFAIET